MDELAELDEIERLLDAKHARALAIRERADQICRRIKPGKEALAQESPMTRAAQLLKSGAE